MPEIKTENPLEKFSLWYKEAKTNGLDPSKMALATASSSGKPSVRMVLLKAYSEGGFIFYTNLGSRKAQELFENPNAALLFYWGNKQIRIEGIVSQVPDEEADQYFATRSRESQVVSLLSKQSEILIDEKAFLTEIANYSPSSPSLLEGSIKRPKYWSGFSLKPSIIEFWTQGAARNHKRLLYKLEEASSELNQPVKKWNVCLLYP